MNAVENDSSYPQKFDTSKLSDLEKEILETFKERRAIFDHYLKENKIEIFTCPGRGYPTLGERGGYEICTVCHWEDDYQDDENADEIWGGPNGSISLTENRLEIGKKLKEYSKKLNKELEMSPGEALKRLEEKVARENKFISENIKMTTHRDDPIWIEYRALREDVSFLFK